MEAVWTGFHSRKVICEDILEERQRQETLKARGKFQYTCADQEMSDSDRLAVLVEEIGEVARAVLEEQKLAHENQVKGGLREELIQVAAVCMAWIESRPAIK